ncbi:MAG: protease pro-enzyme activation domain-containing protein [Capsulimonadaceae bacterium]|nr:protease pro-enzyme activation domain-containing protein [Capsulimonadaceae bacterium]
MRKLALAVLFMLAIASHAYATPTGYVRIAGHVAALPASAKYVGAVDSSQQIGLAISLPMRNQDAAEALIRRMYDPKDVLYGEYLTPEAFTEGYGPTQADYDEVKSYLLSQGLTITKEFSNRLVVDASGPASVVEKAFDVKLSQYHSESGRAFHTIDADPALPAALAPKVQAILGLDTSFERKPFSHIVPTPTSDSVNRPNTLTGPGGKTYGPTDFINAYGLDSASLTAAGLTPLNGVGQTVALVELDGGYLASDVSSYIKYFSSYFGSYSAPLVNIGVDGYDTSTLGDNSLEVTLDIFCVLNIAPGISKLLMVEGQDYSLTDCLELISTDTSDTGTSKVANIVSISYGGGENYMSYSYLNSENTVLMALALEGVSVFAASGDYGAYTDYLYTGETTTADITAADPAVQPYITAVGGTTLSVSKTTGAWTNEIVWNTSTSTEPLASGGGISVVWPIPSYQSANIPTSNTSGYSKTMRNVPDVALDASPNSPYAVCYLGSWDAVAGTSAASPSWAGFAALVNEQRSANSLSNLGLANPTIYRIAASSRYANDFHDITSGYNGLTSSNPIYSAAPGYDLTTGWGSFIGANLIADMSAVTKSTATTLKSSLNPSTTGASVTFTATVTPTVPDGETVSFLDGTTVLGSATTSGSVATLSTSTLSVGSHSITATYGGDVDFDSSTSATLTQVVNALPPSAPADLVATAGNAQVVLTWTASTGATSYNIYRGSSKGGEGSTAIGSATKTTYTDSSLINGTTYYYEVKAVNSGGLSPYSNEASATPQVPVASAPAGLVATAGDTTITLTWTATQYAATYNVYRGTATGGESSTAIGSTAKTTFTDTDLTNGTTYYYELKAIDAAGTSASSNEASATPLFAGPTSLTATASNAQVALTWMPSAGALSYNVLRGTTSGGESATPIKTGIPASTTSYSDTTVTNGTKYYYEVTATLASSTSALSNEASATPQVQAPTSLTASPGNAQVSLSWVASPGATSYNIYKGTVAGSENSTPVETSATTSYTWTGLTNGTTYYFVVTAVCAGGASTNSNEASATPTAPPSAPSNLTATAGTSGVTLTWSAASGATSYNIYRGTTAGGEGTAAIGVSTITKYSDTTAASGTTYYYKVCGVNAGGAGALSNEASASAASGPSYPAGLNFFSSPYDYTGVSLDTLMGYTGVKLAVFEPTSNSYDITPNGKASAITLGVGYWARFPQAVTFTSVGTAAPTASPFAISIAKGWNMIGDPFNETIPLASLTFGSSSTSFASATSGSSPIVYGTFWSYSTSSGSYVAASSLKPLNAYWVYAYSATTMYVPAN